ncbi:MAG: hypothetical protein AAF755_08090 [Pseudomonadota bacterium]
MKPNFALSLSFEGIRLLHRAAGGWRLVGDVALDADQLSDALTALRRKAEVIAPEGVRTKLLLPNDQIKYITIETGEIFEEARDTAARTALAGATPYQVSELVYDTCIDGPLTHIAAVAKETLEEAEAFAAEHQFYPVSFAAVPDDNPYLGEPFFGPTRAAAHILPDGENVEPDGIAVVVVGTVSPTPKPDQAEASQTTVAEPTDARDATPIVASEPARKGPPAQTNTDDIIQATAPAAPLAPEAIVEPPAPAAPPADSPAPPTPTAEPSAAVKSPEKGPEPTSNTAEAPKPKRAAKKDKKREKPHAALDGSAKAPSVSFASRRAEPIAKTPRLDTVAPQTKSPAPPVTPPRPDQVAPPATALPSLRAERMKDASVTSGSLPDEDPKPVPFAASEPELAAKSFLSRQTSAVSALAKALPRRGIGKTPTPSLTAAPRTEVATPVSAAPDVASEAERMTVFGARTPEVGGKPRFLGLILTAALLVFLAGVAAWAAVFLDDGARLSQWFNDREPETTASYLEENITPPPALTPPPLVLAPEPRLALPASEPEETQLVALDPALTAEDDAVLEALSTPVPEVIEPMSEAELAERYALSGIWPLAPEVPVNPSGLISIDDLYLTRVDSVSLAKDAVALPSVAGFDTDIVLAALGNPAAAGTRFAMDARGLVIPTIEGALSPDGITVFLGRPAVVPPATPTRFNAEPVDTTPRDTLNGFRPRARPEDLIENRERARLGGVTFKELAAFRPALRPLSQQEQAMAALNPQGATKPNLATPEGIAAASTFATAASLRPGARPEDFARKVERLRPAPETENVQVASAAAAVAPRAVVPDIPTSASVSRQATVRNAINLRKVNLIGVYGKPSERRALVRLSSGRYRKVVVGDRIDGGRVTAIGNSELRYVRSGRNVVLRMPR